MSASRDRLMFDYTLEQWTAIERAIQVQRPGVAFAPHERRRVRLAAHIYKVESDETFQTQHRRGFAQNWSKVAKLSAELEASLAAACATQLFTPKKIEKASAQITEIKMYAADRSGQRQLDEKPLQTFHSSILTMWVELFGGLLTTSKTAKTAYGGKVVDYFLAVANPVRKIPLKRSSIDGIVDQERRRRNSQLIG